MPTFRYEALTHSGGTVNNTLEAESKTELISRLRQMGYWPTNIVEETDDPASTDIRRWLHIGRRRGQSGRCRIFYLPIGNVGQRTRPIATRLRGHPRTNPESWAPPYRFTGQIRCGTRRDLSRRAQPTPKSIFKPIHQHGPCWRERRCPRFSLRTPRRIRRTPATPKKTMWFPHSFILSSY